MIKGLSEYEKYRVIRPVIGGCELDDQDMPIIRRTLEDTIDWERLGITGFKNLAKKHDNSNTLIHMFSFDKDLMPLWNHPLKRIALFQTCAAVATPDFSAYASMNLNEIRHNVYKARWLGCTWQNYGCTVLPTVGWADPRTYDICFSGIEHGSPVVISTLGCKGTAEVFLAGFKEMKKRLDPSMIVVYGDMIKGMTGKFIRFSYQDSFATNASQLHMECVPRVFVVEEVA